MNIFSTEKHSRNVKIKNVVHKSTKTHKLLRLQFDKILYVAVLLDFQHHNSFYSGII